MVTSCSSVVGHCVPNVETLDKASLDIEWSAEHHRGSSLVFRVPCWHLYLERNSITIKISLLWKVFFPPLWQKFKFSFTFQWMGWPGRKNVYFWADRFRGDDGPWKYLKLKKKEEEKSNDWCRSSRWNAWSYGDWSSGMAIFPNCSGVHFNPLLLCIDVGRSAQRYV